MFISEKIRIAEALFETWEDELWMDAKVARLLEDLLEDLSASGTMSRDFGVLAACKHCEEEEGGSCCGAGIEDRYSPHLLLINLLLGASLPEERGIANSCHFLGGEGCVLKARDILCTNYLCTKIQRLLSHKDLVTLQQVTGKEMDTVFLLHEAVKRVTGGNKEDPGAPGPYRKVPHVPVL